MCDSIFLREAHIEIALIDKSRRPGRRVYVQSVFNRLKFMVKVWVLFFENVDYVPETVVQTFGVVVFCYDGFFWFPDAESLAFDGDGQLAAEALASNYTL